MVDVGCIDTGSGIGTEAFLSLVLAVFLFLLLSIFLVWKPHHSWTGRNGRVYRRPSAYRRARPEDPWWQKPEIWPRWCERDGYPTGNADPCPECKKRARDRLLPWHQLLFLSTPPSYHSPGRVAPSVPELKA